MKELTSEREWKYMRKIMKDLLSVLCNRINNKSITILKASDDSEHEKYLKLYRHIQQSDRIIGDCFNDWRRSKLFMKLVALNRNGLLTSDHLQQLSEDTRQRLKAIEEF